MVDRRLHDDPRKTYLHLKAPRFDLHRPPASSARSESAPCILQVFGPEARDRARRLEAAGPDGEEYDDADGAGDRPGDSARTCGVKGVVDELVRAEGGWLGVTAEARARSWYWITSPQRLCALAGAGGEE
jgi:hypothetical protein